MDDSEKVWSKKKNKDQVESKFWCHMWNGLPTAKHEKKMGITIWLYLWFLANVDREKGTVIIRQKDLAEENNLKLPALCWRLKILRNEGYIRTEQYGNYTRFKITKWRSITGKAKEAQSHDAWAERKKKEIEREKLG